MFVHVLARLAFLATALLSLGKKKKETAASQAILLLSFEVNQCQLLTGSSGLVFLVTNFSWFLSRASIYNKSTT